MGCQVPVCVDDKLWTKLTRPAVCECCVDSTLMENLNNDD
jgi:hypothetical protein